MRKKNSRNPTFLRKFSLKISVKSSNHKKTWITKNFTNFSKNFIIIIVNLLFIIM